MATLTITVLDAHVARIRAAMGAHLGTVTTTTDGQGVVTTTPRSATPNEIEAFLKQYVKNVTLAHEQHTARIAADATVTEVA